MSAGYPAIGYGLYDMAGNVWEWCADWYDSVYYKQFANKVADNPKGPANGSYRLLRGGSWDYSALNMRCASREGSNPDGRYNLNFGFRCVQDVTL